MSSDTELSAVRVLLRYLGEDPEREGLRDTPRRVLASLRALTTKPEFKFTTFESEGMNEMVVQTDIPFFSLCEHHMLPFFGTASLCYIPNGRIVGLSKLARTVQYCATGLQNQERITTQIAAMLEEHLHPQGIGIVLKARHLCMEMRGVKTHDVFTTTSCMRGALNDAATRAEFLRLIR